MNAQDVLDVELTPNQGVIAVINETGDTKIIFDRGNEVEVDGARKQFEHFKTKGYLAYKVEGKDGRRGEVMSEFNPEAERIIFAPRMVGGI